MPLVKAPPLANAAPEPAAGAVPAATEEALEAAFAQLDAADADTRRHAAQLLATDPGAAPWLAARLPAEPAPAVREALFDSLVDIGGESAATLLAPLLRSADAALRSGTVDALKQLGEAAVPTLDVLLADTDPDVRILAVEVTRAWPRPLAVPRLRRVVESDPHVNVCGAAVDVATEAGTGELLPALAGLRRRFPAEPFLLFAVEIACARIEAGTGPDRP
jgi:HEAT repeat protein